MKLVNISKTFQKSGHNYVPLLKLHLDAHVWQMSNFISPRQTELSDDMSQSKSIKPFNICIVELIIIIIIITCLYNYNINLRKWP